MKTQNEAILELLREQGEAGVTPALALTYRRHPDDPPLGCMRLAARIDEIRDRYLRADEEIVNIGWKTTRGARVARYVLRRRQPDMASLWGSAS